MAHLWKSCRRIRMDTLKHWNGVRNHVFLSTLLDLDVVCLHGCVTSLAVEIKCTEIKKLYFQLEDTDLYLFNWIGIEFSEI